jgi:hypothetical protein
MAAHYYINIFIVEGRVGARDVPAIEDALAATAVQ